MNTRRAEKGHRVEGRLYNEQRTRSTLLALCCLRACVLTPDPSPTYFRIRVTTTNECFVVCMEVIMVAH